MLRNLVRFRNPRFAVIAMVIFSFALTVALLPHAPIEKFGYMMAMGFGVGMVVSGVKAMGAQFGNLSVLLAILGFNLILAAVVFTPSSVFAAAAYEQEATVIIGAGLGYFSNFEGG